MRNRDLGVVCGLVLAVLAAPAGAADDEARDRQVMERFLTVLERSPRRGTALDRVYGFHVERGTLDALVGSYRDRLAKDPADGAAPLLLGLIESQRGRDAAAAEAFREAERRRPDDPLPAYYLGQALVMIGQPNPAAEAFERALTRNPSRADLPEIYQALGRVHQRARRDDRALAVWARLEAALPDDPRVKEQIASALAEDGQLAPALARYEALAGSARDPYRKVQFRTEVADLEVRLGRKADAPPRLREAPGRPRPRELARSRGPPQDRGCLPPRGGPGRPGAVLRSLDRPIARGRRGDDPAGPVLCLARAGGRGPGLARTGPEARAVAESVAAGAGPSSSRRRSDSPRPPRSMS